MRLWLAAFVIGFVTAGCGGESNPTRPNSTQAPGNQVQPASGYVDPTPTPEPPYLQLNVEPFLSDSNPAEARVGVKASSENVTTVSADLTLVPTTVCVADVNGSPDCKVAEGANATDAGFSFLPAGGGAGCQTVHAIVTTTEQDEWAMLYSCRLVGQGTTAISVNASATSPQGVPAYVVTEGKTLSWNGAVRLAASASIDPSTSLGEITVSMDAGDNVVAATQNDLYLDGSGSAFLANASGQPDCWGNPAIDKSATSPRFRPDSCAGDRCSGIRALVLSLLNTDPIADGEWLYKCRIAAHEHLAARFSNCSASTPSGDLVLATGIGFSFGN